jgi:hypothetical protein
VQAFIKNSKIIRTSKRLTKPSGKSDPSCDWSKARLAQSKQILDQILLSVADASVIEESLLKPLYLDGCVFWDEKHKKQRLGSSSLIEYRIF